ncbi:MAG TPA: isochorismatase family protein [Terriglobia bacterium]|nr:isochorismatase family protein [Terriglobia bacterium]
MWPQLRAVFPGQEPIERSSMNSWDDKNFVAAIEKNGRKKILIAGLWTEVCVAITAGRIANYPSRCGSPHVDRIRKRAAARLGAGEDDNGNWRNHVAARWQHRHQSRLGVSAPGV